MLSATQSSASLNSLSGILRLVPWVSSNNKHVWVWLYFTNQALAWFSHNILGSYLSGISYPPILRNLTTMCYHQWRFFSTAHAMQLFSEKIWFCCFQTQFEDRLLIHWQYDQILMLVLFGYQSHSILHLSNNYLVTSFWKSWNTYMHKQLCWYVIPHVNNLQLGK